MRAAGFLAVLAVALLLRLPALGWLPSPAGDEGNWTLYGWRLLKGEPVALAPDAGFVSLLFARLISWSMALLGPSFLAARLVNVAGLAAALVAVYAAMAWRGARAAGLAVTGVLAIHPFAVLYSRTVAVPYTLALASMAAGPVLFVAALDARRPWLAALAIQVVALGAHFSPLTAIAAVACALAALAPARRWIFRSRPAWASAAIAALHVGPVVRDAARVARAAPPLEQVTDFTRDLWSYLHMMGTGLAGEATVRHFTNLALPPGRAAWLILPMAAIVVAAARRAARERSALGGFGPLYLLVALLVAPLILAPGRNWYLPANHMDRYLFAVLPAFALCVGDLVTARPGRAGAGAVAALLALLAAADARIAWAYLATSGVDHGEGIWDGGGGYRGWLVSDRPRATLDQVRDHVYGEVGRGGASVLYADRAFIPLHFAMRGTGIGVFDVRRVPIPPRDDGRYYVLLFPPEVLCVGDPPTAHPKYVASNRRLRERMHRLFRRVSLARRFVQRDGSPLFELWRAEDPLPRLLTIEGQLRRREEREGDGENDVEVTDPPDLTNEPR